MTFQVSSCQCHQYIFAGVTVVIMLWVCDTNDEISALLLVCCPAVVQAIAPCKEVVVRQYLCITEQCCFREVTRCLMASCAVLSLPLRQLLLQLISFVDW